jgi:hypothetical protein
MFRLFLIGAKVSVKQKRYKQENLTNRRKNRLKKRKNIKKRKKSARLVAEASKILAFSCVYLLLCRHEKEI